MVGSAQHTMPVIRDRLEPSSMDASFVSDPIAFRPPSLPMPSQVPIPPKSWSLIKVDMFILGPIL